MDEAQASETRAELENRFYYDETSGLGFDSLSGIYFRADLKTGEWKPVDPDSALEPDSDASIRLLVVKSKVPGISAGSILVVDARGVTLGRDRNEAGPRLRLKELNVSKDHAAIYYDADKDNNGKNPGFAVVDLGSTRGTFLDGKRLSKEKKPSKPKRLAHGDRITIASTTFEAHIHPPPWWSCERCKLGDRTELQPELTGGSRKEPDKQRDAPAPPLDSRREHLERQRKEELQCLKRKFVGEDHRPMPGYVDRAKLRRAIHGPERFVEPDPLPKTDIAPAPREKVSGKGAELLAKMGWKDGGGLGKREDGMAQPLAPSGNLSGQGLGFGSGEESSTTRASDWREETRIRSRQRFSQLVRKEEDPPGGIS